MWEKFTMISKIWVIGRPWKRFGGLVSPFTSEIEGMGSTPFYSIYFLFNKSVKINGF